MRKEVRIAMAKAKVIKNLQAEVPTGQNARVIVRERLEEMYSWDTYVDNPYNVRDLHNLRIAAKRLRYTLELFQETFPEEIVPLIKEIEQIQAELGSLHDSDVMIVLLRLCLGSKDGGSGYERMLTEAARLAEKRKFSVNPRLVAHLVNTDHRLAPVQRQGLEMLLSDVHRQRDAQYSAFRIHWYQLKEHNFRQEIVSLLDTTS